MKQFVKLFPLILMTLVGCSQPASTQADSNQKESATTNASKEAQESSVGSAQSSIETVLKEKAVDEYVSPLPDNAPIYNAAVILNSPYHFKNEFGTSMGFDVDLLRAIGEEKGFKVTFEPMEFSQLFPALEDGSADIVLSGIFLTPERQEKYATSMPYSKSKIGYFALSEKGYRTRDELNDKRIGVIGGAVLTKIVSGTEATVIEKPTLFLAFQTIFTDESDATFGTEPFLRSQASQFPESYFSFIPFTDNFSTAMYASKDKQGLMNQINDGMKIVRENGRYQQISQKWFGSNAEKFSVYEN